MNVKEAKGITLLALVITIIVLTIIVGISVYEGEGIIERAQLEEIRTNMLLIQAKSKEYVEKAIFNMGISPDDAKKTEARQSIYVEEAGLEKAEDVPAEFNITDTTLCYWLTDTAKDNWGLNEIKLNESEKYLIKFDEENETAEIYNTSGFQGKYSLSEINQIEL